MTPERKEEIKQSWAYRMSELAHELMAALEEAQQQIKTLKTDKALLESELGEASAYKHYEAERTKEAQSYHHQLAEAQQTIARQREVWKELKEIVSTNATGGRGEDINDYDIMLNIMGDLEGETQP